MYCQICKSNDYSRYKIVERVTIYRCQRCKTAFVHPKLHRKNVSNIYSFNDYKKREPQFISRYKKTIQLIKKYSERKMILEIGGGFGLLSKMLYEAGFTTDVLEPEVDSVYLKGLPVRIFNKHLEDYGKKTTKTYDVIILNDVLEHVNSPRDSIKTIKRLLANEGIVLVQTPNYLSIMAKLVRNWSWWMVEDHRFFFSKTSLNMLFNKENWKPLFYSTYEEWPDFKKNLDGNFKNRIQKALFLIWFIPFYFLFRKMIWQLGYGGLHIAIWQYNRK